MRLFRAVAWAVCTIIEAGLLLMLWPFVRAADTLAEGLQ